MKVEVTEVFERLLQAYNDGFRIFVLEGGSRSSKSWSIVDFMNHLAKVKQKQDLEFTCMRSKYTWVESTIYKTFKKNLLAKGIWDWNMSRQKPLKYFLHGNNVEFIGLDDPQKTHGREQWFAWADEAIELTKDDFDQIEQRTTGVIVLSFNPTEQQHWIFENLLKRKDVFYIHSTMLDNPFISDMERNKILSYEPTPENEAQGTVDLYNWQVYGLGKRAAKKGRVFDSFNIVDSIPEDAKRLPVGIDFGFANDPAAVPELFLFDQELWVNELIYETGLLDLPLTNKIKEQLPEWKDLNFVADCADAKAIRLLSNEGLRVYKANKGADSIEYGIKLLKQQKINVTRRSSNMIYELNNYRYKEDRHGVSTNVPEDKNNHLIDACRYAFEWHNKILRFDSK